MKVRKALKRLKRVDNLLAGVIEQYDSAATEVRALLDTARSSVTSATKALASLPAEKPAAKSKSAHPFSNAARKRLSIAAKRRWSNAQRNGANSLAAPSPKKPKTRSAAAGV